MCTISDRSLSNACNIYMYALRRGKITFRTRVKKRGILLLYVYTYEIHILAFVYEEIHPSFDYPLQLRVNSFAKVSQQSSGRHYFGVWFTFQTKPIPSIARLSFLNLWRRIQERGSIRKNMALSRFRQRPFYTEPGRLLARSLCKGRQICKASRAARRLLQTNKNHRQV